MTFKRIIIYLLTAFITGILILVFIQYNSTKNIRGLINGNKTLINEFNVNKELRDLKRDAVYDEARIKRTGKLTDTLNTEKLKEKIASVDNDINQLQKISDDDSSIKFIDILDTLVHRKIDYMRQDNMQVYHADNKKNLVSISPETDNILNDSILLLINKISDSRQKLLVTYSMANNKSGDRAMNFSIILSTLVLLGAAVLFWYIINIIRRQSHLIEQLNTSEKNFKESARVKENFLANMSHEIRTPMTAILGFANLLQGRQLDGESGKYVQTIQKSAENLLTIINDILDLSKIDAGMMRIETEPFNMHSLLHSVEAMFKTKADEKKVQFSVLADPSLPHVLYGDAARLTQILVNIIGNALKFTEKGNVGIEVTNEGQNGDSISTCFLIKDTGIGIAQDKINSIFERFQQAENAVTRQYGGTGLGLSIVKDLILLQNGTIEVKSEEGQGTTFCIRLTYKTSIAEKAGKPEEKYQPANSGSFEDVHVLVAEDNEINQSLVRHLFSTWNLRFDMADNGRKAIELLSANPGRYNLVLMDIQMPEMDGYTATQQIRHQLKLDIPIIAMTAHALAGEREKCLSYGMTEYISKPIREQQLHHLIVQFTQHAPHQIKSDTDNEAGGGRYAYINLDYMKEISGGNKEYERTVTSQFIAAIPQDLEALKNAWQKNDLSSVRQLAHNMKTTISVMGLNNILQPNLDAFEYDTLNDDSFMKNFHSVQSVSDAAVEEAKHFFSTC